MKDVNFDLINEANLNPMLKMVATIYLGVLENLKVFSEEIGKPISEITDSDVLEAIKSSQLHL